MFLSWSSVVLLVSGALGATIVLLGATVVLIGYCALGATIVLFGEGMGVIVLLGGFMTSNLPKNVIKHTPNAYLENRFFSFWEPYFLFWLYLEN